MNLRDKVAVVTGASSGIGWVTAEALARRGCAVFAVARREERLKQLADLCGQHGARFGYLAGDLGQRSTAERAVEDAVSLLGGIDILVNNAAMTKHKQIYHVAADEVERVMAVNFLSCAWTTFAAIPHMLRGGGGNIVNVSSFASRVVPPREAVYAASKAAMNAFTEGLWNDLEGSGIRASLVIPGAIDTEIWEKGEEPMAYRGAKAPPQVVADAILEVIESGRPEVTVPRRKPDLVTARLLRYALPGVLRTGLRRMDPVPAEVVERARERARRGLPLGQPGPE